MRLWRVTDSGSDRFLELRSFSTDGASHRVVVRCSEVASVSDVDMSSLRGGVHYTLVCLKGGAQHCVRESVREVVEALGAVSS